MCALVTENYSLPFQPGEIRAIENLIDAPRRAFQQGGSTDTLGSSQHEEMASESVVVSKVYGRVRPQGEQQPTRDVAGETLHERRMEMPLDCLIDAVGSIQVAEEAERDVLCEAFRYHLAKRGPLSGNFSWVYPHVDSVGKLVDSDDMHAGCAVPQMLGHVDGVHQRDVAKPFLKDGG